MISGVLMLPAKVILAETLTCDCGGRSISYETTSGKLKVIGCANLCYYEDQLTSGAMTSEEVYAQLKRIYECHGKGNCELNDFILTAVLFANRSLGIVGSIALLFFIYGGVMFLISAGNSERINQAKKILTGAVIGLVLVFISFTIINFTLNALGITSEWWRSGWF